MYELIREDIVIKLGVRAGEGEGEGEGEGIGGGDVPGYGGSGDIGRRVGVGERGCEEEEGCDGGEKGFGSPVKEIRFASVALQRARVELQNQSDPRAGASRLPRPPDQKLYTVKLLTF